MPDNGKPKRGRIRPVAADAAAIPRFDVPPIETLPAQRHIFELTSHARARDALVFGLRIPDSGFNIFVLGEDRSGRMTATLEYLNEHARSLPAQSDWVYLNNFRRPLKPKPYRLPAGIGRLFRARMEALLPTLRARIAEVFAAPQTAELIDRRSARAQGELEAEFAELQDFARTHGVELERSKKGVTAKPLPGHSPEEIAALAPEERARAAEALEEVRDHVDDFKSKVRDTEADFAGTLDDIRRELAEESMSAALDELADEFGKYMGLARWIVELRGDLAENLDLLIPPIHREGEAPREIAEDRYAVNLIVDHGDEPHMQIVLEPNPTYENLFGAIEYRQVSGVAETDFTLIRAGALHRANGGVLVLRAEAVAQRTETWRFLKGALRDGCIRIEEPHREGGMPMAGAPSPKPVPLKLKVVIVGAPRWYYTFFSGDPDFTTYFKVKADIDPDMPASGENVAVYAGLLNAMAQRHVDGGCAPGALQRLLGEAARWAGDRTKLSARFELVEDVLAEAAALARRGEARAAEGCVISVEHVRRALEERRLRNARVEDRSHETIRDGVVMIDTDGAKIGQINALVIRDLGDYDFGLPSRVTARVFIGRHGIVNIERSVEMGGPMQQKGVFIIGGYLNGRFAQRFPLSFSATLTFEQNYGGVEGDSASMAELLAILSALAEVPLRQDVGITGSVNQNGQSQAVGGVSRKIEGFHRTCRERGLTGRQGVLVPRANERNLVLGDEVVADIEAGRFHIWSMEGVDDGLEHLTGMTAAAVAAKIEETLERFDGILRERASLWN